MSRSWKTMPLRLLPILLTGAFASCLSPRERALHALSVMHCEASGHTLLTAVSAGEHDLAELLLEAGVFTGQQDRAGRSPLAVAVQRCDMRMVRALLNAGADPNTPGALAWAVEHDDSQSAGCLLASGASASTRMQDGESLLPWAIIHGRANLAREMVSAGADPHASDLSGKPLLQLAIGADQHDVAMALLDRGADAGAVSRDGTTTLHTATRMGWLDMIVPLAKHGADPNAPVPGGKPLLVQAVEKTNLPLLRALVRAGADPHFETRGDTPWQLAFASKASAAFDTLLEEGAAPPEGDWSAWLRKALTAGDATKHASLFLHGITRKAIQPQAEYVTDVLREGKGGFLKPLLAHGCPPGDGLTIAATKGDLGGVNALLDYGVSPDHSESAEGDFPLAAALRAKHDHVAKCLVQRGADTNRRPPEGQSVFLMAIAAACPETVKLLLASGADPNCAFQTPVSEKFRNIVRPGVMRWVLKHHGEKATPMMMAVDSGNIPVAAALIEAGAHKNTAIRSLSMWPINFATRRSDVPMMRLMLGADPHREERKIVIDLSEQRATVYAADGGTIFTTRVSTGKKGHATPKGTYAITNKYRTWTSTLYHAEMPYFQRLSCGDFGLHQGVVPGYPASHGCIRVPAGNAKKLYSLTQAGDRVTIVP